MTGPHGEGLMVLIRNLPGQASRIGRGIIPAVRQAERVAPNLVRVVRPESWIRPAGVSPAWVETGLPSSRPRFVVERRRAERGVKSLFGGSKIAGRSVKRTLQPRHRYNGKAEPLTSRRRPRPTGPVPGSVCRVSPGYGRRHVIRVWFGTGETRLPGPRRAKTDRISQW